MTDAISSLWHRLRYTRLRDACRGRLDASLDWQGLIALAELPPELAAAVRQVVSRSRLWRSEKVDVAAELIAHFQDGLAAGRTPAELLQSFGDPQASAQLIRRAKRRGRPAVWHAWRYWLDGLGGDVRCCTLPQACGWRLGRPTVKIDYLADFNKPAIAVPEDQRAWPIYRDALLAMGARPTKETRQLVDARHIDAKPGEADWKKLEAFLKEHADSLAKLREAAARPSLGFVASTSHADFSAKDRELFGVTVPKEEIELAKSRERLEDRWLIAALMPDIAATEERRHIAGRRRAAGGGSWRREHGTCRCSRDARRQSALRGIAIHGLRFGRRRSSRSRLAKQSNTFSRPIQNSGPTTSCAIWPINWQHRRSTGTADFKASAPVFTTACSEFTPTTGTATVDSRSKRSHDKNLFQMIDSVSTEGSTRKSAFSNAGLAFLSLPAANHGDRRPQRNDRHLRSESRTTPWPTGRALLDLGKGTDVGRRSAID